MLEALGLTAGEEAVYRLLVDAPRSVADLAAALDRPAAAIEADLTTLTGRGLVSRHPDHRPDRHPGPRPDDRPDRHAGGHRDRHAGVHLDGRPDRDSDRRAGGRSGRQADGQADRCADGHEGHRADGSADRHGDRYAAAPPSVALGGLLTARREELRTAELAIVALAEQHRMAAADRAVGDLIEVVTGVEAVRQRFLQIQWAARERVRSFSTAPFVAVPPSDNTAEDRGVDRGIEYQVAIEREVLATPGAVPGIVDSVRKGVQVRVADKLPIKLMMADSELALVPLTTEPGGEPAAVLLHRSGLLTGVEALFEAVWQRAYPLRADALGELRESHEPEIGELDRKILALLLSGLTDEAVAGQLDLSLRTLQRRLRALMDLAGVRTRVQLGWHAARHDWA
ncbi:helix-turn-helix domain-containing protein [Nonomuraea sp. PA05]|uniref:response regulator transcription factor n=1 Tax=Nonomuraea sp. PA05 TaxID=2604466 RepID=UPI0011DAFAB0|nr:response regulator transcription factor [Nonomuraea sp. PA05]TYB51594.1 helix-turn-helix domain-containing protein [Nonomuraea sp. PA05]